jgi:hypothetical protein
MSSAEGGAARDDDADTGGSARVDRDAERETDYAADYSRENTLSAMTRILREEGPAALFLGLAPRVFRAVLSGALQFSTYEFTKGKTGS